MAHMIHENNAVYGRGIPAWHRLGTVLEGLVTVEEAVKAAGFDSPVEKVQAYYVEEQAFTVGGDGSVEGGKMAKPAPGCYLTLRRWQDKEPTVLGHVGEQYTVLQDVEAFGCFEPIMNGTDAVIDSAGMLGRSERVWMLAKMPSLSFEVGKGDEVETFMLVYNSHDGSSAVRCRLTPIRVVCHNTLTWALARKGQEISLRHTSTVAERTREAGRLLKRMHEEARTFKEVGEGMGRTVLGKDEQARYILDVLGIDSSKEVSTRNRNILEQVAQYFEYDPLAEKGTVWAAYNALTAYVDHGRTFRSTKGSNGTAQLKSIWFGSGAKMKERAFQKAAELVKV